MVAGIDGRYELIGIEAAPTEKVVAEVGSFGAELYNRAGAERGEGVTKLEEKARSCIACSTIDGGGRRKARYDERIQRSWLITSHKRRASILEPPTVRGTS